MDTTEWRVAVVLGTRPEIIKLAGVIDLLGDAAMVVHTGQHYDAELSDVFFTELGLAPPHHRFAVGGGSRAEQIGRALVRLDDVFADERPDAVVVQGDTNATLAGAIAANARGIPLVHVEAGLRSFDRAMPEEHNRVLTDHISDILCAATPGNVDNLASEGITSGVHLTGNTVVEAVARQLPGEAERRAVLARHGCRPDGYVLATLHRPENTDDPAKLGAALRSLGSLGRPVILPLHPRTRAAVERDGLGDLLDPLRVIAPLGSREFLSLAAHAALLVSDSGGVQEECTVLKRPLLVVRNSTERPESVPCFARLVQPDELRSAAGAVLLAGADLLELLATRASPYGDGTASRHIVELTADACGTRAEAAA